MLLDISRLRKDEQITLQLAMLFEDCKYKRFRMSKFEEYSFYLENKNFLKTEQIIPFSDNSGKLLALKPDITLSIAKACAANANSIERVYYIESVYRYAKHAKVYKEVPQIGLEVMGAINKDVENEVLNLAIKSLELISESFVLDLSHSSGKVTEEVEETAKALQERYGDRIRVEKGIAMDTTYYNGIIFQGFVEKVPSAVLSGGRYDPLMQKFGKKSVGAIGFALSLDGIARYY